MSFNEKPSSFSTLTQVCSNLYESESKKTLNQSKNSPNDATKFSFVSDSQLARNFELSLKITASNGNKKSSIPCCLHFSKEDKNGFGGIRQNLKGLFYCNL